MLRLAYPGWRTLTDLQSEAVWVNALDADLSIPVPTVMPARSGELVVSVSVPEVPDWAVVMEGHLDGTASAGISLVDDQLLYPRF